MTLRASQVSYRYAKGTSLEHQALSDVSLEIVPGTSTLLIGNTGSGKSTLLRQLAGLMKPDEGSVELDGSAVMPGRVGIVFQNPESQLFADTVLDDVAFGPKNFGKDDDEAHTEAREALERIGLSADEFGDRSPFSLSGGQARRVAIAGVLAFGPAYVLFDEPTAGLDGTGRGFVKKLIDDLLVAGTGVLVVSHDVDEFLGRVDRVALMAEGRIVWQGPSEDLIADPGLFTKAGLAIPDILVFQQELGCMKGSFSFDADEVAAWAKSGYLPTGPREHDHEHADGCDRDGGDA